MNKNFLITIISLIVIIITSYFYQNKKMEFNINYDNLEIEKTTAEELCYDFLIQKMSKENLVFTNYLDSSIKKISTGHEVLSESIGLLLFYYIEENKQDEFVELYNSLNKNFLLENGTYSWRIKEDILKSDVNSSIDDLRILKALNFANEKLDIDLSEDVLKLEKSIYDNLIINNRLLSYANDTGEKIDVAYLDIYSLYMFKNYKTDEVIRNSIEIIEKGYISDDFPMYYKEYSYEGNMIVKTNEINLIDSLLTVYHLAEVDRVREESIKWINNNLEKSNIYSYYNVETGKSVGQMESSAIYGIILRIAKKIRDKDMYNNALIGLLKLQVMDTNSEIYGSFGNQDNNEIYSYDNLQALLGM